MSTTTTRRSHVWIWVLIVAFFAGTFVFSPLRIVYKHNDEGAGGTGTVALSNFMFKPSSITVPTGSRVVFENVDVAKHTVAAEDGSFDSGPIEPGESFEVVVDGTVTYHCDYHADMKATIEVTG